MRTQVLLIVLVVGAAAVAGFFVGRGTRIEPPAAATAVDRVKEPLATEPSLRGTREDEANRPVAPVEREVAPPGEGAPDEEVARRAAAIQASAERMAATAEVTARRQMEAELAAEPALLEDAGRGGTMALLRRLERKWTPPNELLGDSARYGALFEQKAEGVKVDGRILDGETKLKDGDTVEFPPGRFALDNRLFESQSPFPKDLSVEGYGMDETVLVLSSDLRVRSEVHSLTFRDLTLHCDNNSLERMRKEPYTLRLERVRVIGFDSGAGGSKMLGGSVGAFYATDCRIESGYGRAPGFGNLFDVRGALLARLDNCDVVGPFQSVYEQSGEAAQLFVNCRFTRMRPSARSHLEEPKDVARFENCSFEYLPSDATSRRREPQPLTDINPTWK